jgi:hypothetical protein
MNQISVNVQDSPYVRTNTITNINIRIISIELFTHLTICVSLFDNNQLVDNVNLQIIGDEYNNWGNDDQYIVDLVLSKLCMSKKE